MGISVRNALTRCKGVGGFGSASLRHKLAQDGARGFRIGKGGLRDGSDDSEMV